MPAPQRHLAIKSEPENLEKIRSFVTAAARSAKLKKDLTGKIVLAVDETCSNIIRHGYNNDPGGSIRITIDWTPSFFKITIRDTGIFFNLSSAKPRDPDEIKVGGLGLYIIKQIMDKVTCVSLENGQNITTLVKNI